MNSLTLRRSIRGRSIEFTRLLILSMLEDATDTFSVTLSLLNSELGQCNLNADQFLQHLTRLLDELRTKIKNNKEEEDLLNSSSFLEFALPTSKKPNNDVIVLNDDNESIRKNNGFSISEPGNIRPLFLNDQRLLNDNSVKNSNQSSSKRSNQFLNKCNMCKVIVPNDQKFYFGLGLCSTCYQSEFKRRQSANEDGTVQSTLPTSSTHRVCKRCRKNVSSSTQKAFFKGYCSSCYYKTRRLNRLKPFSNHEMESARMSNFPPKSCLLDRQCSECAKIVPKTGIFYRSAQLCKNCYERQRVSIRKASQKQCSMCKKMTSGDILSGKCIPCYYQEIHVQSQKEPESEETSSRKNSIEQQFDSIDESSNNQAINALLNLCPDLSNCHSCNKLATQSDLDNIGNCRSCQTQSPTSSVKVENDMEH